MTTGPTRSTRSARAAGPRSIGLCPRTGAGRGAGSSTSAAARGVPAPSVAEAENCTLLACDVHRESVEWVARHLPVEAFQCGAEPPFALEDGTVDLVLAVSVFTHLSESWARWLSELGRVLAADGVLLATVHGAGVWQRSAGARFGLPYDERIGMHVEQPWEDFDSGFGPSVWHGEWWLREHWGRGFDVLSVAARVPPPLRTTRIAGTAPCCCAGAAPCRAPRSWSARPTIRASATPRCRALCWRASRGRSRCGPGAAEQSLPRPTSRVQARS